MHYEAIGGALEHLDRYQTIFVDSITAVSRLSFRWAEQQPEAVSERTGRKDIRGAYGLHGREMILWLNQLQHARDKSVVFVGILEKIVDEFNHAEWQLQMEGSKTGRELPAIVDQIISYQFLNFGDDKPPIRGFVCTAPNVWNYPAKDRSGRLDQIEQPDLGKLTDQTHPPSNRPERRSTMTTNPNNFDFNDAGEQRSLDVIPANTVCTLQLTIRPGGVGDGGWLKRSADGASEGLDCEFVVVDGQYAKRKLWALFTLAGTTQGHETAGDISRSTFRAILEICPRNPLGRQERGGASGTKDLRLAGFRWPAFRRPPRCQGGNRKVRGQEHDRRSHHAGTPGLEKARADRP